MDIPESKINKQKCSLARKGHENMVIVTSKNCDLSKAMMFQVACKVTQFFYFNFKKIKLMI